MKIREIIEAIESWAPPETAAEWDNVGLMLGDRDAECKGVAIALDCTMDVVAKAETARCNLIVTHHPLIFHPLKNLDFASSHAWLICALLKKGMTVYSAHTNLDGSLLGASATLAKRLSAKGECELVGFGAVATVTETTAGELAKKVAGVLGDRTVKVSAPEKKVKKVYIISGAGGHDEEYLEAKEIADVLITGEVGHHVFVRSTEEKFPVVEFSHYNSETICCDALIEALGSRFNNLKIIDVQNESPFKTLEEV